MRKAAKLAAVVLASGLILAGCTGGTDQPGGDKVKISFSQWWEPEMPEGSLQGLIDQFETANPGIEVELLSQPYASVQTQMTSGAAAGNLPDVLGLDGAWVHALHKQGALANLSELMSSSGFDTDSLRASVDYDGSTFMIPFVNFAYPLFTNDEILAKAGVASPPTTWSEFAEAARKISQLDGVSGTVMPLGTTDSSGARDIMSWTWATGGSMLKDGQPALVGNQVVTDTVDFWASLVKEGLVLPGSATMQEGDKLSNFANGRVGMMVNGLTIISTLNQDAPDLKYSVSGQPVQDGYSGTPGMLYASWGIGVAEGSAHQQEAWKLVQFLLDPKINATMSTAANGFPGVNGAEPAFGADTDPRVTRAWEIYQASNPVNEFVGLPSASQLQNDFVVEFQKLVNGDQSTEQMLATTQQKWEAQFK
ncbi:MAG: sugar ABC transporter substrate-binding protein [Propionicimonas sp.]